MYSTNIINTITYTVVIGMPCALIAIPTAVGYGMGKLVDYVAARIAENAIKQTSEQVSSFKINKAKKDSKFDLAIPFALVGAALGIVKACHHINRVMSWRR